MQALKEHTLKAGWLEKRGGNFVLNVHWSEQYFVLTFGHLYRFPSDTAEGFSDVIPLDGGAAWGLDDPPTALAVGHRDWRTYILRCKSEADKVSWLSALQEMTLVLESPLDASLAKSSVGSSRAEGVCEVYADQARVQAVRQKAAGAEPRNRQAVLLNALSDLHPALSTQAARRTCEAMPAAAVPSSKGSSDSRRGSQHSARAAPTLPSSSPANSSGLARTTTAPLQRGD